MRRVASTPSLETVPSTASRVRARGTHVLEDEQVTVGPHPRRHRPLDGVGVVHLDVVVDHGDPLHEAHSGQGVVDHLVGVALRRVAERDDGVQAPAATEAHRDLGDGRHEPAEPVLEDGRDREAADQHVLGGEPGLDDLEEGVAPRVMCRTVTTWPGP